MTKGQIKLVAKYACRDHEANTLADYLATAIVAILLPKEVEYYNETTIESALNMLLSQKGAIEE